MYCNIMNNEFLSRWGGVETYTSPECVSYALCTKHGYLLDVSTQDVEEEENDWN